MVIIVVSWEAGSAPGRKFEFGGVAFWRPATRKWCLKGAVLKTMKIEHGTPKHFCLEQLGTGSLPKRSQETVLNKYEKSIGKSMFFDGPKPLDSIEKQIISWF